MSKIPTAQKGQASFESMLIMLALVSFISLIIYQILLFGIQIQISNLAEELSLCRHKIESAQLCQLKIKNQSRHLLAELGLQNIFIQTKSDSKYGQILITAKILGQKINWRFKRSNPYDQSLFE